MVSNILLCLLLFFLPPFLTMSMVFIDKQFFVSPLEGAYAIEIRSDRKGDGSFGSPRNGGRAHNGIDILAAVGTPVCASRSGRVTVADQPQGMGKYIVISHGHAFSTLYGHLSGITVAPGMKVRQGQRIGFVGKTGNAEHPDILPHLHFEVKKDNQVCDPADFLK